MKARRFDEAVEAYRQSLRYRPNYAGTYLNVGYALRDSGRFDEAAQAWQEAARLAPNDPTARAELAGLRQSPARSWVAESLCPSRATPWLVIQESSEGVLLGAGWFVAAP